MKRLAVLAFFALAATVGACKKDAPPPVLEPKLSTIQTEVFAKSCTFSQCHNAEAHKGSLDLSTYEASFNGLVARPAKNEAAAEKGLRLVAPAMPEQSFLYKKLVATGDREGAVMPKKSSKLEAYKIEAVRAWILAGAPKN